MGVCPQFYSSCIDKESEKHTFNKAINGFASVIRFPVKQIFESHSLTIKRWVKIVMQKLYCLPDLQIVEQIRSENL